MATSDDNRSMSVRLDGKGKFYMKYIERVASVEHQIDIHVQDLSCVSNGDFTLDEILQGLKYVYEYRVKGGKLPSLESGLMKRLLEGLLSNMSGKVGNLVNQRPTAEADLAFELFVDFMSVEEFRQAVSEMSTPDLCHFLKIHRRCQSRSTDAQKRMAARALGLLTSTVPQSTDWREFVKEGEEEDVDRVMKEYASVYESAMEKPKTTLYPPPALYFDKNVEKLAEMYRTDLEKGLPNGLVSEYQRVYGLNKLPEPPKPSILSMLWTQISDFIVVVLLIVAIVEAATGGIKEAVVLAIVILVNVVIGFSQEYQANKALEALMSLSVPKASVIRQGNRETVESSDLVPGDLVVLEEGDAVPADLRICEVAQLEIVESILTGESVAVSKSIRTIRKRTRKLPLGDCKGNAFMSTVVAKGRGHGIVVRTGEHTEIGRISKSIVQQPHQRTSIQKKLDILGKILVVIAFLLCVLVAVIGIAWGRPAGAMFIVGLSLAVSVIPEGLVVVVTVTMSIAVKRMAAQNALVRKLPSVETLGSVTVICSDKTGTLTEGKMGTSEVWTSDNSMFLFTESTSLVPTEGVCLQCFRLPMDQVISKPLEAKAVSAHDRQTASAVSRDMQTAPPHLLVSCMIASLCNNASVVFDEETKTWMPLGDPTEVAMTIAAQKAGFPSSFWIQEQGLQKMGEYAFDSDRKLMSVLYKQERVDVSRCFVLSKGAPEGILSKCTGYLGHSTSFTELIDFWPVSPITDAFSDYISQQNASMASSGLRVLALAMRLCTVKEGDAILSAKKSQEAEKDLVFVGLIGLIDPPKKGVAESVASCKKAGIKVVMITGDHIATATSIAKQIGILDPNCPELTRAMKGYEVDLLSEEALASLKPFPVVFARVSPDNKLKIVKALQSSGNSCAMTGDGVNDAAAVKKADVGVAMGLGGTEITKQAADIVLADDNFTSIVKAVKEGRRVFDNIRKFVVYLLSCNSAEIFLFILAVSFNLVLPFTVIQILWANIIADIPPAMSLGIEPFEVDVMDRPPRPPSEGVLTLSSWLMILAQGMIQTGITFLVYIFSQVRNYSIAEYEQKNGYQVNVLLSSSAFLAPSHERVIDQQSLAFFTLTTMQLIQSFLSRSVTLSVFRTGITSNKWCLWAFLLSFSFLVAGFYIPLVNDFLELRPLIGQDWLIVLVCLVIQLVLVELLKVMNRRYNAAQTPYVSLSKDKLNDEGKNV